MAESLGSCTSYSGAHCPDFVTEIKFDPRYTDLHDMPPVGFWHEQEVGVVMALISYYTSQFLKLCNNDFPILLRATVLQLTSIYS